jgi:hypothetical protein
VGCRHHDDVRNTTEAAGSPQTVSAPELRRGEARSTRTDERAEGHEGGDQLLPQWREIPADWSLWSSVAINLECYVSRSSATRQRLGQTHLQKAWHRLKTTDEPKVNAILKW